MASYRLKYIQLPLCFCYSSAKVFYIEYISITVVIKMVEWRNVSIPRELYDKIARIKGFAGYHSISDFVVYCIRGKKFELDNIIEEIEMKEKSMNEEADKLDLSGM